MSCFTCFSMCIYRDWSDRLTIEMARLRHYLAASNGVSLVLCAITLQENKNTTAHCEEVHTAMYKSV